MRNANGKTRFLYRDFRSAVFVDRRFTRALFRSPALPSRFGQRFNSPILLHTELASASRRKRDYSLFGNTARRRRELYRGRSRATARFHAIRVRRSRSRGYQKTVGPILSRTTLYNTVGRSVIKCEKLIPEQWTDDSRSSRQLSPWFECAGKGWVWPSGYRVSLKYSSITIQRRFVSNTF